MVTRRTTEKEKAESIWRRKNYFAEEKKKVERKEGNYWEKENIFLRRRKITENEEEKIFEKILFCEEEDKRRTKIFAKGNFFLHFVSFQIFLSVLKFFRGVLAKFVCCKKWVRICIRFLDLYLHLCLRLPSGLNNGTKNL